MERLKIGISASFFHADPERPIFTGKTLQYIEQSVAHWVMSSGALALMIPSPDDDAGTGGVTLVNIGVGRAAASLRSACRTGGRSDAK